VGAEARNDDQRHRFFRHTERLGAGLRERCERRQRLALSAPLRQRLALSAPLRQRGRFDHATAGCLCERHAERLSERRSKRLSQRLGCRERPADGLSG
jgi:hypothetical protein